MAELLLQHNANKDCRTKTGITPLFQVSYVSLIVCHFSRTTSITCLLYVGLQQIFDSFGYSLELWYSNSKINIRYLFTYLI